MRDSCVYRVQYIVVRWSWRNVFRYQCRGGGNVLARHLSLCSLKLVGLMSMVFTASVSLRSRVFV